MKFEDRIYGSITVDNPVIQEIILSPAFQRLKGINQYGGVNLIYPERYQISRFEHSLGVWWVLHNLGVSLETEVAGLLHDVGHTAFSHMVDLAIGGDAEDFHENHLYLIPGWENLQAFLARNHISLKPLEHYPEVKTSMPRVGADRLDYAIRDFVGATNITTDLGRRVIAQIILNDRIIHFADVRVAREFALTGLQGLYEVIYAPEVAVVYEALTEMLRAGIKAGWLTPEVLYGNDDSVFRVLSEHQSEFSSLHLKLFTHAFTVHPVSESVPESYRAVKGKIRYFDPPVLVGQESKLLSEVDPEFKQQLTSMLEAFERRKQGEFFRVEFNNNVKNGITNGSNGDETLRVSPHST